jgi:hypothetical protein
MSVCIQEQGLEAPLEKFWSQIEVETTLNLAYPMKKNWCWDEIVNLEETSFIFSSLDKSDGIYSSIFSISLLGIGSPLQNFSKKRQRPPYKQKWLMQRFIIETSMQQKHLGKTKNGTHLSCKDIII